MNPYLFTDETTKKIIERKLFDWKDGEPPAEWAEKYRKKLQRKSGKPVIAWAHMGGNDNLIPTWEK